MTAAREEHILVVGGGRELPGLLRGYRPGVRTSVLCQLSLLPRLREVSGHERVVSLGRDSADAEWIAAARQVHAQRPITRIATFGERDQLRAAVIGAALGIATHSVLTVTAVHQKHQMRRRLAEAGVEDVPWAELDSAQAVRDWVSHHPGQWVVKPVDGSGSAGVSIVADEEAAAAAYLRCVQSAHTGRSGSPAVLVEQFLAGTQISVESLSEDGDHCLVATTRKYSDPVSLVELGHVVPAGLPSELTTVIATHLARVLDALGVRNGVCHTELVLTEHGPRVIETHLRLAGDEIPYLVRDATGVDLVAALVRQTLGEPVLADTRSTLARHPLRSQAIWFGVAPCAGRLVRVEGQQKAAAGIEIEQEVPDGSDVTGLQDSDSRPLWARADGATPEAAIARARAAVSACRLLLSVPAATEDSEDYL